MPDSAAKTPDSANVLQAIILVSRQILWLPSLAAKLYTLRGCNTEYPEGVQYGAASIGRGTPLAHISGREGLADE